MTHADWPALEPYIVDVLMPDLVGHDQRPSAFVLYLCLWRLTAKFGGAAVRISHQRLANAAGLSRSTVQEALEHLAKRQLVVTKRSSPTSVPVHEVKRPWARRSG